MTYCQVINLKLEEKKKMIALKFKFKMFPNKCFGSHVRQRNRIKIATQARQNQFGDNLQLPGTAIAVY